MDDRRFDSLVRALAEGKSRRSVLKGLLGLGGAALVGSVALDGDSEAARRPTNPTPTPVRCPGIQTNVGGVCTCPATAPNKCGPDCCTGVSGGPPLPTHSECCDNACCFGTCYGEELCCPTNTRAGEQPPTHKICDTTTGPECCSVDEECCAVDGCCVGGCYGGATGHDFCCTADHFCSNASGNANLCCAAGEICCAGGTDDNICAQCCSDADCPEGVCQGGACVCLGLGEHCTETTDCCQDKGETTCRDTIRCNAPQDTICCRPVGSVCADSCDCCGTIPCEGGQCCLGEGMGACNGDSANCCAGLECVGDPGDDACRAPEPPCVALGDTCEYGSNDCCLDDIHTQCNSVYSGKDACPFGNDDVCCRAVFGACSETCNCCGDLVCENSACCQVDGGFCFYSDECCSGLACVNDTCLPCAGLQESCSASNPCCDSTSQICTGGGVCACAPGFVACEALGTCVEGQCCDDTDCVSVNPCLTYTCDAQHQCVGSAVVCPPIDSCTPATCDPNTGCPTASACAATGQTCCPDGVCRDSCDCGGNGTVCDTGGNCCGGCCIANFSTFEDWLKVCTDAGISGPAAQLCAQAIVDQGYPGTCQTPNVVTFPAFPANPVTLPCFD